MDTTSGDDETTALIDITRPTLKGWFMAKRTCVRAAVLTGVVVFVVAFLTLLGVTAYMFSMWLHQQQQQQPHSIKDCIFGCGEKSTNNNNSEFEQRACFFLRGKSDELITVQNSWCPLLPFESMFDCMRQAGYGVLYPGPCGCPENCQQWKGECRLDNDTGSGGGCQCKAPYSGPGCALCEDCQCNSQQSLQDCTGESERVDEPLKLLVGDRFSSWDKYGWHHPLFNQSTITEVYIEISWKYLEFMLDPKLASKEDSPEYFPCKVRFKNNAGVDKSVDASIRIKGNFSRMFFHKSFKLKFEKSVFQQKRMSLKAGAMEPGFVRELASANLLYSMNSPSYRGSHVQLFVNDQFFGAYIALEDIGKQFLKSRFEGDAATGALYKCTGTLRYYGPLNDATRPLYTRRYNGPEETLPKLVDLLRTIDERDLRALEQLMDVEALLRAFAVEVMTGNWDGIWNGNNYFLYWQPVNATWIYFRHDLDISYGVHYDVPGRFGLTNFSDASVFNWTFSGPMTDWDGDGVVQPNKLTPLVLRDPHWRQVYISYLQKLATHLPDAHLERLRHMHLHLFPLLLGMPDQWRSLDWGWTPQDFSDAIYTSSGRSAIGTQVLGVAPFIEQRVETAMEQIEMQS